MVVIIAIIEKGCGISMTKWTVEYYVDALGKRSVEKWFDSLTKEQFKSVAKELKLLELCGNDLKLPHSRSLGKGLFELRERRFCYLSFSRFYLINIIILLEAVYTKTQKNDIKMARENLANLLKIKESKSEKK